MYLIQKLSEFHTENIVLMAAQQVRFKQIIKDKSERDTNV